MLRQLVWYHATYIVMKRAMYVQETCRLHDIAPRNRNITLNRYGGLRAPSDHSASLRQSTCRGQSRSIVISLAQAGPTGCELIFGEALALQAGAVYAVVAFIICVSHVCDRRLVTSDV